MHMYNAYLQKYRAHFANVESVPLLGFRAGCY